MSSMRHDDIPPAQSAGTPEEGRSADYSDGYRGGRMPGMEMSDQARLGTLRLDQFEYTRDDHGNHAGFLDGEFQYGGDFDRLSLEAEGRFGSAFRTEALWTHAVSAYWNTLLGLRHDFGEGPARTFAGFGLEGLAPYRLETQAAVYVGEDGRTAARLQLEYEARFTQRLVLQPKLELNLYGKDDPRRGIGAGLSDAEFGLRLRYEIRRGFAPYLGVAWQRRYGRTADLARARGDHAGEVQFVAGLRVWL
ncbi:MAG TPA: copper resistance protein B [Rhodanobacteraceae bacterium]|nr:copper resistance protein B [Rhodanobacteraceae bacterium]